MAKKIVYYIDNYLEEVAITVCMGYFTLATVLQVVFRFVLQMPAAWTDETARYSFIWMMFLGAAVAVKKNTHISVDILQAVIKNPAAKKALNMTTKSIFLIFTIICTVVGVQVCLLILQFPQTSPVLEISMFWVYVSMPVGMGLASLRLIQSFFKKKEVAK